MSYVTVRSRTLASNLTIGSWVVVAAVLVVEAELLPPNNPVKDGWSPRGHLLAASHMAAGDVNALFHWKGTWRLMFFWFFGVVPRTQRL